MLSPGRRLLFCLFCSSAIFPFQLGREYNSYSPAAATSCSSQQMIWPDRRSQQVRGPLVWPAGSILPQNRAKQPRRPEQRQQKQISGQSSCLKKRPVPSSEQKKDLQQPGRRPEKQQKTESGRPPAQQQQKQMTRQSGCPEERSGRSTDQREQLQQPGNYPRPQIKTNAVQSKFRNMSPVRNWKPGCKPQPAQAAAAAAASAVRTHPPCRRTPNGHAIEAAGCEMIY